MLASGRARGRFSVALSFAGEQRGFVKRVANLLAESLCKHRVLYDVFLEAEFTRMNLDQKLQDLYRDESDLIVLIVCGAYDEKSWCGLEWRAIRAKLPGEDPRRLMVLSMDGELPAGIYGTIDGLIKIDAADPDREAERLRDRIVERWHHVWFGDGYDAFAIHDLLRIVEGVSFDKGSVASAWLASSPPPADRAPPVDFFEAIRTLASLIWGHTGAHPLLQFVEQLRGREDLDPKLQAGFARWLDAAVLRHRTSRQVACALPRRAAPDSVTGAPYLLVWLRPPIGCTEPYYVDAWLSGGGSGQRFQPSAGESFERAGLEAAVADVLSQASQFVEAEIRVEFIVPRALLDLPFDRWEYDDYLGDRTRLGIQHHTVVKSAERLLYPVLRKTQQGRWDALQASRPHTIVFTEWPDVTGTGVVFTSSELRTDDVTQALLKSNVGCAVLNHPPPARAMPPHDIYNALMKSGVAIALWGRPCLQGAPRPEADTLRGALHGLSLDAVPGKTQALRVEASRAVAGSEWADGMTLLWDDPTHVPPDEQFKPPAIRPKGSLE